MRKTVKLSLMLLMMISIIFCTVNIAYAKTSSNVAIASVSEVEKGEEFTVKFNLSNLKSDKGINALMGTLKYDKDSLTLVKIEGQNGWASPSYNEENGKFVTEISEYVTKDGTFMKVTFKVREGSKKNINISMENISVANQDEEIEVSSTSKSITLKGSAEVPDTNTNTSTNQNTNTNTSSNTNSGANSDLNTRPINSNTSRTNSTKNDVLPNTGKTDIAPIVVIAICIVLVTVFIMRLKTTQNKGKH